MKRIGLFIICFLFFLSPLSVWAIDCNYDVVKDSLAGTPGGTIECSFSIRTNGFSSFFLGKLDASCKFIEAGTTNEKKVELYGTNVDTISGFNLEKHMEEHNTCPKYLKFQPAERWAYIANTEDQLSKATAYAREHFSNYYWATATEKSHLQDTDVKEKYCSGYQEHLNTFTSNLQEQANKYNTLNCEAFKLTEEEKNTVASPENLQLSRECDQILSASVTLSNNANQELNDYVTKGCLTKDSDEYKNYQSTFNQFHDNAQKTLDNIKSELGNNEKPKEEKDKADGTVNIDDMNGTIGCTGVFGTVDANGNFTEESFGWLIQTALNYIKIAGPILVILLSMIEFIKAILSSDEEAMKKAQSRLVIRIIAVVALFLLPFLVGEALKLINGISNPTCGFK